jgi:hypothetical protein
MYLGVWAKLKVIRDAVQEYISLESFFPSHDLCKVMDVYRAPSGSPQKFEDVCAHVNAGSSECTTGDTSNKIANPNCRCGVVNRCGTDKYLVCSCKLAIVEMEDVLLRTLDDLILSCAVIFPAQL